MARVSYWTLPMLQSYVCAKRILFILLIRGWEKCVRKRTSAHNQKIVVRVRMKRQQTDKDDFNTSFHIIFHFSSCCFRSMNNKWRLTFNNWNSLSTRTTLEKKKTRIKNKIETGILFLEFQLNCFKSQFCHLIYMHIDPFEIWNATFENWFMC